MSVYSENQVRHLYVLVGAPKLAQEAMGTTEGTIRPAVSAGNLYFDYVNATNEAVRTDLIKVSNITSAKATDASAMSRKLKSVKIALDSNVGVVAGLDYIMRIVIKLAFGMSDLDTYYKHAMVHAIAGMSAHTFYKTLAESLLANFAREITKWFSFAVVRASDHSALLISNKDDLKAYDATTTAKTIEAIVINEVELPWRLGVKSCVPVYFDVYAQLIYVSGDELTWGVVTDNTSTYNTAVNNGKETADLEYFLMGERGDLYRAINFPDNIETKYLVNKDSAYHYLDIAYNYAGPAEDVQKSPKVITIVCASKDNLNSLITAINAAAGTSIATLS